MTQANGGNGHSSDVNANDIDTYEKIPNENPLTEEQTWLKENLGTGEREIVFETPEQLKDEGDEPKKN
ncbi:hypothetical protein NUACC21_68250 [Scytonema sp. NUACC21]